jgi:hypothetical protein
MLIWSTSNGTIVVVLQESPVTLMRVPVLRLQRFTFADGHGGIGALSTNFILIVSQGLGPKTCFKAWFGRKASADLTNSK